MPKHSLHGRILPLDPTFTISDFVPRPLSAASRPEAPAKIEPARTVRSAKERLRQKQGRTA
jgi:hypothetical protein